jgi:hypothetical protein
MRQQSGAFRDVAAYAIRIGDLYQLARENQDDPWFQQKVEEYLSGEGFYYYPELDSFGMLSVKPESEWVPADDPEAERKAWLLAAKACQNGHRGS